MTRQRNKSTRMNTRNLFLCLLLSTGILACNKNDELNYKITKASFPATTGAKSISQTTSPMYEYTCADGSTGCGSGNTVPCTTSNNCPKPPPPYHSIQCDAVTIGCGLGGAGTGCYTKVDCPVPPPPPDKHPAPCNYGTIPFGCFTGWSGGPTCSTLVNCQIPPP